MEEMGNKSNFTEKYTPLMDHIIFNIIFFWNMLNLTELQIDLYD